MSHSSTRKTKGARGAHAKRMTVVRAPAQPSSSAELLRTSGSLPSFAGSALDSTSCSRFDLNTLLAQVANDLRETVPLQLGLSPEPLRVFASVGHLSTALQEMARFLARSLRDAESIRIVTSSSSAQEIVNNGLTMGHLLFPFTTWNAAQHSQRPFGIVRMVKEGGVVPGLLVGRFLQAARNVGNAHNGEDDGLRRLGRVLRKHRANLAVFSTVGTGTTFQLFIPLADGG